jgi:hypothetical protein
MTSSWQGQQTQAKNYKKVLVLAIVNEADRTLKEKMETHLVNDLREKGVEAICACEEFGPKTFENIDEAAALAKLDRQGIDAVLTIVLLDKQKERYYVPGRVYYSPYFVQHRRFWGYYTTMYNRVYSPGYYATEEKYFWESNFYDLTDGQELLYSAQSQSFSASSAASLAHDYGQMIVKDMIKRNVFSTGIVRPA